MGTLETQRELREATKGKWKALLACPEWALLVSHMRSIRVNKRNEILTGADDGLNGLIENAKSKAELAGIELVLNWPTIQMEECELDLVDINMELAVEAEQQSSADSDSEATMDDKWRTLRSLHEE